MNERLCLLEVHAHPDDEASKGAGVAAKYASEGVWTVLVTCTGGEAGEILNPAADDAETRANLAAVRLTELRQSVAAIGYGALRLLGYRDSGMAGTAENSDPRSFAQADLDEATGRLVEIIRQERPQVVITYGDDQSRYPHPDHVRVHEISVLAFERAGEPKWYPEAGEPWQPAKLYYVGWSRSRLEALHAAFEARGFESPFKRWLEGGDEGPDPFTTRVDVSAHLSRVRASLLAHRTQVDPDSFWLRLPDEALQEAFPWEEFVLARSHVAPEANGRRGEHEATETPRAWEGDLFAGVRDPAVH
ncbi:MAG: PIG-L family deacetylase [Acidimicrobiia bacterium]